ncbi:Auxin response factor 16 [Capsicum chinense]|nr:Auxin response factor 16 [Capsicum chinense]
MRIQWCFRMKLKMAFEAKDSSRINWFMGTISSIQVFDPIHWSNSPWRLLQAMPHSFGSVTRIKEWIDCGLDMYHECKSATNYSLCNFGGDSRRGGDGGGGCRKLPAEVLSLERIGGKMEVEEVRARFVHGPSSNFLFMVSPPMCI